jgi:hypothetical protein
MTHGARPASVGFWVVLLCALAAGAAAERTERLDEQWRLDPPYLFTVPVARPLPPFDVSVSAGSTFATGTHQIAGSVIVGLGGLAQAEYANIRVLRDMGGDDLMAEDVPAGGLKVYLPVASVARVFPDVAAAVRRTFERTRTDEANGRQQVADLHLVGSWNLFGTARRETGWRGIEVHAGAHLTGARLSGAAPAPHTSAPESDMASERTTDNRWRPFGGLEIWTTRTSELIAEVQWTPVLRVDSGALDTVWSGRAGMRFFFSPYFSADIGATYREDFETIADAQLLARASFAIPVHQLYERYTKR